MVVVDRELAVDPSVALTKNASEVSNLFLKRQLLNKD